MRGYNVNYNCTGALKEPLRALREPLMVNHTIGKVFDVHTAVIHMIYKYRPLSSFDMFYLLTMINHVVFPLHKNQNFFLFFFF